MKTSGIFILALLLLMGCKASNTASGSQDFEQLRELVNKRVFTINFQFAQPHRGGMIDLTSNPNEITIHGDQVAVNLPFFGQRQRGGGYSPNTGGIAYEGVPSNLTVSEDPSKNRIFLKFEGRQGSEHLVFNLILYGNGNAQVSVSSSDRDNMIYQGGNIKPVSRLKEP